MPFFIFHLYLDMVKKTHDITCQPAHHFIAFLIKEHLHVDFLIQDHHPEERVPYLEHLGPNDIYVSVCNETLLTSFCRSKPTLEVQFRGRNWQGSVFVTVTSIGRLREDDIIAGR